MAEEYRRKYSTDTVPSMWANFRKRPGLDRRIVRDDDLIPWAVAEQHRNKYPVMMLRALARVRAGMGSAENRHAVKKWLENLGDRVVHYDPDTQNGFSYVRRMPGDDDVIRKPARKTTLRPNSESKGR